MIYNIIVKNKISKESKYSAYSVDKVINFFKDDLGYCLNPVQGSYNKFWMSGKYIKDNVGGSYKSGFMNGPKYYKLVVNDRDFGIESGGDLNGWQMAGIIKQEMLEALRGAK